MAELHVASEMPAKSKFVEWEHLGFPVYGKEGVKITDCSQSISKLNSVKLKCAGILRTFGGAHSLSMSSPCRHGM